MPDIPTPKPKRKRLTGKQRVWLSAYEACMQITKCPHLTGISHPSHYKWLKNDPLYKQEFLKVDERITERLESEAVRRAYEGVTQKKFTSTGAPIIDPETGEQYIEREFSTQLLVLLLRARLPNKYRENVRAELVGPGGGPVQLHMVEEIVDADPAEDNSTA